MLGSSLMTSWLGSGLRVGQIESQLGRAVEDEPDLGLGRRQVLPGADEEGNARPAPVVDVEPEGGVRLGRRVGGDAIGVEVALVLAAHVVRGVGGLDRAEDRELRVLDRLGVAPGGGLHGGGGDHLHDVVDHDVPQRADRVVEVTAVLHPEALGHGDLHAGEAVPVPDRLQHRVGEAEVEELLETHLPEEVVDPVDLGLVEVLVELGRERAGRVLVVTEGLLDDHTRSCGEAGCREPLDDRAEEEGGDLQVEDRVFRTLGGGGDLLEGGRVGEVTPHVGEPRREPVEDLGVEVLPRCDDRVPGPLAQFVLGHVIHRDPDDGARQEPARLEPVQRSEGHHPGEVSRDPEDHEDIGRVRFPAPGTGGRGHGSAPAVAPPPAPTTLEGHFGAEPPPGMKSVRAGDARVN